MIKMSLYARELMECRKSVPPDSGGRPEGDLMNWLATQSQEAGLPGSGRDYLDM